MDEVLRVGEILRVVEAVFAEMLHPDELASSSFVVTRVDDWRRTTSLARDDLVESGEAWVRWRVCGEDGGSSSINVEEGRSQLVRRVQSDLQDFIAESRFGWGQLRGPRDLP
ncbi:hypothetical protein [Curtobacterium sp. Leaf261]|uniref:hypothetical protein n=1 Tax=Curtobacterium sp. Leaf261 TaxID=1736311 RepID=UPI0006FFDE08|nr:hypothetical protein [Curtobacterium sp. Leaf261]KQO60002.1 hypothetical protein ASF23_15235 [Curtobacterium sp. Leaf261]